MFNQVQLLSPDAPRSLNLSAFHHRLPDDELLQAINPALPPRLDRLSDYPQVHQLKETLGRLNLWTQVQISSKSVDITIHGAFTSRCFETCLLCTRYAPYFDSKTREATLAEGRFDKGWGGVARLEWRSRFFAPGMHKRGLRLEHVSEWMPEAPARLGELLGRELARQ